ncbi:MAG TPA: hypothetical protein VG603_11350 [Chitinophagales bacterium]|nr:hypothetical protein [Chitinophagales bacterium]
MKQKNNDLSDNLNVPVYYFKQFLPSNRLELNQDKIAQSEYQGCWIFYHDARKRVAQISVYKTCFDIRIYHVNPYPAGFFQNIDWNDSQYIEITKRVGKVSGMEICSMLNQWGYELRSSYFESNEKSI